MKDEMTWIFKALADPGRVKVFEVLLKGNRNVTELVGSTSLSQPCVSRHLRILREAGLVEPARNGKWISYRVGGGGIALLESTLAELRGAGQPARAVTGNGLEDGKSSVHRNSERRKRASSRRVPSNEEDKEPGNDEAPARDRGQGKLEDFLL